MQIIEKKLSELKPYENNPKQHNAEQIEFIMNSLKEFGWKQAIVIDKNNVIVAGHGRYLAAKKLAKTNKKKWENVPCILADDLTDDQIKAYRLVDNRVFGEDYDLDVEIAEIEDIELDLDSFGISTFDMDEIEEVDHHRKSERNNIDEADKGDYFSATFVFPIEKKKVVEKYLRKYKNNIIQDIILDAEDYAETEE